MSYLVLARKYRPRSFDQLVGQEHVVQALSNALAQQRLHHAYLFTGTRGVGKTTISRILAKALNCVGPDGTGNITAHPCGQCQPCRDIDAGRFVDYVELDAASHRGVEEISQLLEQAIYKPVVGRFKVYMIDEVHMLSTTAFNAMLKTLEEPPDYLKFVLATTDPQKVPITVLSRCLQFSLRPMPLATIVEHLQGVTHTEHIPTEPRALQLIARAARGSMRDALSLTDQAVAFSGGHLSEEPVRHMLGAVDRAHIIQLMQALAHSDGPTLVQTIEQLRVLGLSASGTLDELVQMAQQVALVQIVGEADPGLELSEAAADLKRLAQLLAPDEVQLLYNIALHGRAELAWVPDEYGGLLMVLLRVLAFMPARPTGESGALELKQAAGAELTSPASAAPTAAPTSAATASLRIPSSTAVATVNAALQESVASQPDDLSASTYSVPPWVDAIESAGLSAPPVVRPASEPPPVSSRKESLNRNPSALAPISSAVSSAAAVPIQLAAHSPLGDQWAELVQRLTAAGSITALTRELAWQSECVQHQTQQQQDIWQLRVESETLRNEAQVERLRLAMAAALAKEIVLQVHAGVAQDTPAQRESLRRQQRQQAAEQLIQEDSLVQELLQQFKTARIVPGSIRPV